MKITAPVKGFTGESVGVVFTDGVGHTDDEVAIGYFTRAGYTVEPDEKADEPEGSPASPKRTRAKAEES